MLEAFLSAEADVWTTDQEERLEGLNYDDFKEELQERFRSRKDRGELLRVLTSTSKKSSETFESYGARLRELAEGIPGGLSANYELVLTTFVEHALPEKKDLLKLKVDVNSRTPDQELASAVRELEKLAEGNGVKVTKRERGSAAVAEGRGLGKKQRREDKPKKRDYSKEVCSYKYSSGSVCGETGHTTWFHNKFFPNKPIPKRKDRKVAFQGVKEADSESEGSSDEGAAKANVTKGAADSDASDDSEDEAPAYCFATGDLPATRSATVWGMDSCCTHHMTGDKSLLDNISAGASLRVRTANNGSLRVTEKGTATLVVRNMMGHKRVVTLTDVYYVPGLTMNLISVGRLTEKGVYYQTGKGGVATCVDENSKIIFVCERRNGLYQAVSEDGDDGEAHYVEKEGDSEENWHTRLGHADYATVRRMARDGMVRGIKITKKRKRDDDGCTGCYLSKIKRANIPSRATRSVTDQRRVASVDMVRPINVISRKRNKYIFFHNFLGHTEVWFGRTKDEATPTVIKWVKLLERRESKTAAVAVLRSDGGWEYTCRQVVRVLEEFGIAEEYTEPETPHQNGTAERKHQTVLDMARTMLLVAGLLKSFWEEAVDYAVYIRIRIPSKGIAGNKTPHELMFGEVPSVAYLRVFGEQCVYRVIKYRRKLNPKVSRECLSASTRRARATSFGTT